MSTSLKSEMSKCNNCYVSQMEKTLHKCARCKAAKYCSRECQKADWPNHKGGCQNNADLAAALKAHDSSPAGLFSRFMLPDGISMYELDQRLEQWVKFHNPAMMGAALHALDLRTDIQRTRTHVMHVKLEARPRAEHGGAVGKYFRVLDVVVVEVKEAMGWPEPWPASLIQLREMQDTHSDPRRGYIAAAMVECPPLAVQTVPFGSIPSQKTLSPLPTWKEVLMQYVDQGKRFNRR